MVKVKTNLITGITFLLVGVFIFLTIDSQILTRETSIITAKYLPKIISIILILFSAILILMSFSGKEDIIEVNLKEEFKVLSVIGVTLLYSELISKIGFYISSMLVGLILLYLYGSRNIKYYLIISSVISLIYLLFTFVFKVQFP